MDYEDWPVPARSRWAWQPGKVKSPPLPYSGPPIIRPAKRMMNFSLCSASVRLQNLHDRLLSDSKAGNVILISSAKSQ